jgi:hypothetical protein
LCSIAESPTHSGAVSLAIIVWAPRKSKNTDPDLL